MSAALSGVRARPLVWRSHDTDLRGGIVADGCGYRYTIIGRQWWRRSQASLVKGRAADPRAACQEDYEACVLASLASDATPAPTSGSEDGGES